MPRQLLRRRLTETEMARGVGMLEMGASQRQVATAINVTQSVIPRCGTATRQRGQSPTGTVEADNAPHRARTTAISLSRRAATPS